MEFYRNFEPLDPLPANWADALERFLSVAAPQFALRIKPTDATVLEVPASANTGAAAIAIQGSPRWNEVTVERASLGGGTPRSLDVWVTSTADVFVPGSPGEVDSTVYAFALAITETGLLPAGAIKRKVGTAFWDGAKFTSVVSTVGAPTPWGIGAQLAVQPVLAALPTTELVTGREILFQTAGMAAAGVGPWTLRYDSALSGTSKWKVLGADSWHVGPSTPGNVAGTSSGAFGDFSDLGPTIALPALGDYLVTFGAALEAPGAATLLVAPAATGLTAVNYNDIILTGLTGPIGPLSRQVKAIGISGTLKLQHSYTGAGTAASLRFMEATPLRLG